MKRVGIAALAAAALLSFGAAQAIAANHSGPEQAAKGTGETSFTSTTSSPITGTVCITVFSICFPTTIANTVASTATRESFSFDAKLGPQTDPLDPTNGAYGQMKIDYEATTTTSVVPNPGVCSDPTLTVIGGCPAPSSTVAPPQTATATADVTCLNTVQNRATVGGHVTKFSGNFTPTRGLLFNGTDNTIANQQVAPDQFAGAFMADVPAVCPPPSADHPITSGDVYVQQS
jgi:hypothetical protein